jgi:hypothetical protein
MTMVTTIAIFALSAQAGNVQEVTPGGQWMAGTRIGSSADGVSIMVPSDWMASMPQGMDGLLLSRTDMPVLAMVTVAPAMTPEQVRAQLAKPQDLGAGMMLNPKTAPRQIGQTFVATYQTDTPFGPPMVGHVSARMGEHATLVVVAGGLEVNAQALSTVVSQVVSSVVFEERPKPIPGPQSEQLRH